MTAKGRLIFGHQVMGHIGVQLIAGLIILIPVIVTYLVIRWLFFTFDGVLQPLLELFIHRSIPGAGLVALLILIYLLGVFAANVLGRRAVVAMDYVLGRTPFVRYIYSAARQVADSFRIPKEASLRRVALVEFPRAGVKSLAFVTGRAITVNGERVVPVLIPTAPNPTSGFLVLVPESEVVETDMTIEEAFRMVVSGGIIAPETIAPKSGSHDEVHPSPAGTNENV